MENCIITPLQKDQYGVEFGLGKLKLGLHKNGIVVRVGRDGVGCFIPSEALELFLVQRTRAESNLPDPCPHCADGETIFVIDGKANHHIFDGEDYQDAPCQNLQK